MGVFIVLQMGRPGGGLISECILGRKHMFPGLGESINKRSAPRDLPRRERTRHQSALQLKISIILLPVHYGQGNA